ncbi:16S rRNA (cytidine(1402)-2'-O)-methyltransferase [Pseudofulvimonas gallinarii]|uniref:Ribosomal RNA small subunit methyltransferase I n=1 Tax=Pseudofulvimonas gallinarii TaxID=634155 RepID=A0A4R3LA24_9GAMM|nr:16S rRNA (cytidine(1402)-2'-O)-methyltransferase [Pseudofulvimonas gallinarii]TCS96000.1 16S rRNA (cytidine1402-2'-O)-methyltransferase [Pseudofulvimonas gallinarii]THD11627.1 16S rRNA (cytidine(1402)-2'-O)-methyltransferase [Pseudofulvimonas gallinarii]
MIAEQPDPAGTLYVVATPIGNLEDISARALRILGEVSLIAAEDTRGTRVLLDRYGIGTPMLAVHEHNESAQSVQLVQRMRGGASIALVSDAGTPLISDPGFRLVAAAREAGIPVRTVPGPCAGIAALSIAGIAPDRFCFEGFLPAKGAARRSRLAELAAEPRTLVFYESSHRIVECVDDLVAVFGGDRQAVLARELTKRFETTLGERLVDIAAALAADADQRRGEFVLVVAGNPDADAAALVEGRRLYAALSRELPPARAAKIAAELSGAPRRALYSSDT